MLRLIDRFRRDESGAAMVEYGLLIGLIAVVCIIAVTSIGTELNGLFTAVAADLPAA
jgi:pilus assembly protein Flp/PilA